MGTFARNRLSLGLKFSSIPNILLKHVQLKISQLSISIDALYILTMVF